jgi:sulfate adenylyltransferase subunit 1
VQWVIRPQSDEFHDFRGYAGRIAGGVFKPGDEIIVHPSGFTTRIKKIYAAEEEIDEAFSPLSVTMTTEDEIDISRGNMISKTNNLPNVNQDIEAMICWFSDSCKLVNRAKYIIRHTSNEARAVVTEVKYKVNVNTLHKVEDDKDFKLNDIGKITLRTSAPLIYDSYRKNRTTGSFILIDPQTNETIAAGMIL